LNEKFLTGPFLLFVLGDNSQMGTYILRISVTHPLHLSFGRFKGGKVISLPEGDYLYVGSALGRPHASPLARRLIRHASRSNENHPHPVRAYLLEQFLHIGLGSGNLLPKNGKTLFWNIDHLLDRPEAELTGVVLIRSEERLESSVAKLLMQDSHTHIVEKGLGANDARGETHFLGLNADDEWWHHFAGKLSSILNKLE
jgi:Uri superfamily endonuclease